MNLQIYSLLLEIIFNEFKEHSVILKK